MQLSNAEMSNADDKTISTICCRMMAYNRKKAVSSSANFVAVQLLVMGVLFVSQTQSEAGSENAHKWAAIVACFVVYILTARGLQEALSIGYDYLTKKELRVSKVFEENRLSFLVYLASSAILLATRLKVYEEDFPLLLTAYLICRYLQMEQRPAPTINYGVGMACSFFEGYLSLVIPSHGQQGDSFVDKLGTLEDGQGIVFPVKKLLLVVTKSLYCPPDLKHFNLPDRKDLPQIEACKSPETLCLDVAGVKRRRYRNTAYKIYWPDGSQPPVYITAECATPLHTLYGVLQKRDLYEELLEADVGSLVSDFCAQVERVVARSPACRGKCELVHFDDHPDSGEYLPLVLLHKVAELEPRYREIIANHAAEFEIIPPEQLLQEPRVLIPPNLDTERDSANN